MSRGTLLALSLGAGLLGCAASPGATTPGPLAAIPSASAASASPEPGPACSTAQPPAGHSEDFVARVEVMGNKRTTQKEICHYIRTAAGHDLDRDRIAYDVRELFLSGFFEDVQASSQLLPEGRAITFTLRERPSVKQWQVKMVGEAPAGGPDHLLGKPGDIYDPASLQTRAASLREDYAALGYPSARVSFQATPAGSNEVLVEATVEAGPRQTIKDLRFTGVSKVKMADLLALFETNQGKINAPGGIYQENTFGRGLLEMNAYYYDRGMISVKVGNPELTPSADQRTVSITVPIEEGPTFKLDKISCVGDLASTNAKCISLLGVKKGEVFSRIVILAGIARIRDFQALKRHGDKVEVATDIDQKAEKVNLKLTVSREAPARNP